MAMKMTSMTSFDNGNDFTMMPIASTRTLDVMAPWFMMTVVSKFTH